MLAFNEFNQLAEEELNELSKATLGSYIKRASKSHGEHMMDRQFYRSSTKRSDGALEDMHKKKAWKREDGIKAAVKKLTKEGIENADLDMLTAIYEGFEQLDELSKKTLGSYIEKSAMSFADAHHGHVKSREDAQQVGRMDFGASKEVRKSVQDTVDTLHTAARKHDIKRSKRGAGMYRALKRLTKEGLESMTGAELSELAEEISQLDELSKQLLGRYIDKAATRSASDAYNAGHHVGRSYETDDKDQWSRGFDKLTKSVKRQSGIKKAVRKLAGETK